MLFIICIFEDRIYLYLIIDRDKYTYTVRTYIHKYKYILSSAPCSVFIVVNFVLFIDLSLVDLIYHTIKIIIRRCRNLVAVVSAVGTYVHWV